MKTLISIISISFSLIPTVFAQEAAPVKPKPPVAKPTPLAFIPEKVTETAGKGQAWIIDDKFAAKHKAKPLDHAPFVITLMPTEIGKVSYHTRPNVPELLRLSLRTKENKKLAESIRFTSLTMPTNMPMDERLFKSAELQEKQLVTHFAKGHKSMDVPRRYKTKVGPYNAAVVLGKLTLKDDSILFIKTVAILRENNHQGVIAVMILDPTTGKKEELKQRLADGYVQQVLHSFRFLKKKAPVAKEKPVLPEEKEQTKDKKP